MKVVLPSRARTRSRHLTLADLCQAIADGDLPAKQQGNCYAVRKRDVVRYASRLWPQLELIGRAS